MHFHTLSQIFDELDSDDDGLISEVDLVQWLVRHGSTGITEAALVATIEDEGLGSVVVMDDEDEGESEGVDEHAARTGAGQSQTKSKRRGQIVLDHYSWATLLATPSYLGIASLMHRIVKDDEANRAKQASRAMAKRRGSLVVPPPTAMRHFTPREFQVLFSDIGGLDDP